jgi:hypothetical protein
VLVVAAVLVVGLGVSATVVLVRTAAGDGIPQVSDISAVEDAGTVEFSWADPGLNDGDRYQIEMRDGTPSIQSAIRGRCPHGRDRVHHGPGQSRRQDR